MNLRLIVILIFIFLKNFSVFCQNDRKSLINDYSTENQAGIILKTNPFTIITGPIVYTSEYRLTIEAVTFKKQSFQAGLSYLGKGPLLRALEKDTSIQQEKLNVNGFRFQFSYKFYFSKKTLLGFYLSPTVSYSTVKFKSAQQPQAGTFYHVIYENFGLLAGYQFLINKKLAFDFFFGYGNKYNYWYEVRDFKYTDSDETNRYFIREPIKIYLGFNMGLAF